MKNSLIIIALIFYFQIALWRLGVQLGRKVWATSYETFQNMYPGGSLEGRRGRHGYTNISEIFCKIIIITSNNWYTLAGLSR